MKKAAIILVLAGVLISAIPVTAEYYKYIDKNGTPVFTDDLSKVPEDQRPKVQQSGGRQYQERTNLRKSNEFAPEGINLNEENERKKFEDLIEKAYNIKVRQNCPTETRAQVMETVESVWNKMTKALVSGDIDSSLTYFSVFTRDEYRRRLSGFSKAQFDSFFGNIKGIHLITLNDSGIAECGIIREEKGGKFSYPARFVRDPDCVWRINGF